jgi:(1->4)-alpha-D-glucan 1-alpha-D-glucosylmutase
MVDESSTTYRVQLRDGFDFSHCAELAPYLAQLGITHLYLSPIFYAPEESTHGYDVANPNMICPSLGGREAFERMVTTLKQYGLKVILDIVPNHMSTDAKANQWWCDVLEKGNWSFYESSFDIYWEEFSEIPYRDKIILPILGKPLNDALENGEIRILCEKGTFYLTYYSHLLPINLKGINKIFDFYGPRDEWRQLKASLDRLKTGSFNRFFVTKEIYNDYHNLIKKDLLQIFTATPQLEQEINERFSEPQNYRNLLHEILECQYYKLIWWKKGRYLINYRRFFNISDLIAMRIEQFEVFRHTHELIIELYANGLIEGLRVDHPDGLSHPSRYFEWLREHCPQAYIIAEKITGYNENFPDWPIDGSTGYEFLNDVHNLFIKQQEGDQFDKLNQHFTQHEQSFSSLAEERKRSILEGDLEADFQRVLRLFYDLVYTNRTTADFSVQDCSHFLTSLIISLDVYRTYLHFDETESLYKQDIAVWQGVIKHYENSPRSLSGLATYFLDIIKNPFRSPAEQTFIDSLQKLTGPVMAKAVEDTVFYRFHRFVSLNEVGGHPSIFGLSPDDFNARIRHRAKRWPLSLLATSTHDTKRSEDVRARLAVISEIPERWRQAVTKWLELRQRLDLTASIDAPTEYFMWQNLVGSWPISEQRFQDYMLKAAREANLHSSWRQPDNDYEQNISQLIAGIFASPKITASLGEFVSSLEPAASINSLSQTLLKLTCPGVADIYQGCESYSYTLVDPDNRQPIDYKYLTELLTQQSQQGLSAHDMCQDLTHPQAKLWLTSRILHLRRQRPELFASSAEYQPLECNPKDSQLALAYQRGRQLVVITPRFYHSLNDQQRHTKVHLKDEGRWQDIINDRTVEGREFRLDQLWKPFPACVLVKTS